MIGRSSWATLLGCLSLAAAPTAAATTVYKCTAADGRVIYQDAPCARSQRQHAIRLSDVTPPVPTTPPPKVAPAPTAPSPTPAPAPTAPVAPLPTMYACQGAVDGKTYLSRNGRPRPYLAPFGLLGAVQQPLGDVYGRGGAGASAPELNRGNVTSGLIGNNYVWVQDLCRPLSRQETCEALQEAYEKNEHQLKQAFQSERAPFEQREAELQAQLTNC